MVAFGAIVPSGEDMSFIIVSSDEFIGMLEFMWLLEFIAELVVVP